MTKNFIHKKVLIAPLDWGLGHVTRCIPLIRYLQHKKFEIIFAGSPVQLVLIKKEFPNLLTAELKGYNINYTKSKRWFSFKILTQVPKILLSINAEKRRLQHLIKEYNPKLIISDNRYGFYDKNIQSVFITHQLQIAAPFVWMEKLVQKINYGYISHFNQCWVPDFGGEKNIAGKLSHPPVLPRTPIKYLGPLSRFNYKPVEKCKYKYLLLISGPEPQRSLLEGKLLSAVAGMDEGIVIVRGKPDDECKIEAAANCTVYNHLDTIHLEQIIAESEFIISRPGYTSVMEILAMHKKSLLIPTPGQTEQEYLAQKLSLQHWCCTCNQDDDLLKAIKMLEQFQFKHPAFDETFFEDMIDEALEVLFSGEA